MNCLNIENCNFVKLVMKDYIDFCNENLLEQNNENLIRFLCSHRFIKKKQSYAI